MADLEQRVAAGAALLDRERPGWWEEVDTEQLDLGAPCDCILGQLHGHYTEGVLAITGRLDDGWAEDHGFTLIKDISWPVWHALDRLVLDPFAGSGTTLQVAHGHGRSSIGIDLDGRNYDLARQRLGMFLDEPTEATA